MNNAQTHLKMGYVWTICLVAACGGLLFGYDWVVIGGAKPFYEAWFSITDPAQSGWAMSSALLGCIFGALISGWCADKLGRKLPLILSAVGDAADECGQLEWADGLALDVRCGTGAGAGVSGPDVFCPRVAALAHEGR